MNIQRSSSARSVNGGKGRLKKVLKWMETSEEWNKTVLYACVAALVIDSLFLFIPEIDYLKLCIGFDEKLRVVVSVLRSLIDLFYVIHIIGSLKSLRSLRNLRLLYMLVAILPIPQIVVGDFSTEWSNSLVSKSILKWIIVCQYIPRIIRIYPIYQKVTKTTGRVAESKWIGAALNLLLFMLFGYVFGAFWYVTAIEKKSKCWSEAWFEAWAKDTGLTREVALLAWLIQGNLTKLYCSQLVGAENNSVFLNNTCPLIEPDEITKPSILWARRNSHTNSNSSPEYDFGLYIDVLKTEVGSKNPRDFPKKVVYCLWWGLRNLSTYAQGLIPGNSATDTLFAIIICASGLFLFAVLIGNVQKYLNSSTVRVEEMEEKRRDTKQWMDSNNLPDDLQERIKEYEKNRWRKYRGTDQESLLRSLPEELRLEIKVHLDKR